MSPLPTIAPSPTPSTAAAALFPVHRRFSPPLPAPFSPRRVALPRRGRIACEVAAASAAAAAAEDEAATSPARIGARVRVKGGPLKVYHVPKVAELDLGGREGVLKQYVVDWKGKKVSANLPFKVEFVLSGVEGRQGPLKFFAHLREDEFDYLD